MSTNAIKDAFASAMKGAGFKKKGDSWYQDAVDAVLVANLQKSNFGEQYYVNLAAWLKALGTADFPKEHHCHVRIRATALDPDRQRYWEAEVFNLDHGGLNDPERGQLARQFLEDTAIPLLKTWGSLEELRRLNREGHLQGAAILARAQPLLQE